MTTLTDTQVITASGGLVELGASTYTGGTLNISSSSAASPTNVISDTTVVCDGSPVEIEFFAPQVTTGASGNTYIALWKDGAEFVRYWGVMSSSSTTAPMRLMYRDTPTAGSHTYSVKGFYATAAGQVIASTGGTAQAPASLRVSKIVQATQWPAVTTGTIICTSSTRPASPFEGQTIYETDTKRTLTYDGSDWFRFSQLISASSSLTSSFTTTGTHTTFQDVTNLSCSASYGANRRLRVSCEINPYPSGGANSMQFRFVRGSTTLRDFQLPSAALDPGAIFSSSLSHIFTGPSAGATETFKIQVRAHTTNTAVSLYGDSSFPYRMYVEDIGPA